jgi:hypothetical protein
LLFVSCSGYRRLNKSPARALWDAVKKSLDVAQKPVNLRLFTGIKALSQATLKAAQRV